VIYSGVRDQASQICGDSKFWMQALEVASETIVLAILQPGSFVWLIDQSAGIPANFDNAMKYANLGILYMSVNMGKTPGTYRSIDTMGT
jgi:hypothetical protein